MNLLHQGPSILSLPATHCVPGLTHTIIMLLHRTHKQKVNIYILHKAQMAKGMAVVFSASQNDKPKGQPAGDGTSQVYPPHPPSPALRLARVARNGKGLVSYCLS